MRIISGEFRSRKLQSPPPSAQTRPIPDRVKEAVFNLLRGHFEGARVLDVFAGTGSIGIEALSRGAASCTFVERDRAMARTLETNIETLECTDRARVIQADALGASLPARIEDDYDLIFFDPPYPLVENPTSHARVFAQFARFVAMLTPDGFASIRTPWPFVHAIGPGESVTKVEVDLKVEGAVGPETHVYRHTAVHLYMRETEPRASATGPRDAMGNH